MRIMTAQRDAVMNRRANAQTASVAAISLNAAKDPKVAKKSMISPRCRRGYSKGRATCEGSSRGVRVTEGGRYAYA